MTSRDGLALLEQMHRRGEITDEQYDTLRRHVIRGMPLPQAADAVPLPRSPDPGSGYVPGTATVGPDRFTDPPGRYGADPPARSPDRPGGYGADPSAWSPGRYPDPRGRSAEPFDPPHGFRDPDPQSAEPFDPSHGFRDPDPRGPFPAEPVGGYPVGPVRSPGPAPARYASRQERREAEQARAQPAPLPPVGGTGPLPPVGEAPARRRHRRDDVDTPPPDEPHRHGLAPPADPTPRRGHRAVEADRRRRSARPDKITHGEVTGGEVTGGEVMRGEVMRGEVTAGGSRAGAGDVAPGPTRPAGPEPGRRHRHGPPEEVPRGRARTKPPPQRAAPAGEVRRERRAVEAAPEVDRRKGGAGRQKRRPRRRSVVAVLTSVVLALALAAGGVYWFELRRQGLAPPAYARQACGAVRDWQQTVDSSNAKLVNQISRQQNKTTIRSDVTAYYTTIAGSTDQLRIAVLDLGAADLTGGREYADSLAAAIGDQARALRRLAGQAGRLEPAAATFQTDLQGVLSGADAAVSAVTAALARPAAGITTELRTTLSNEPACAPYVG